MDDSSIAWIDGALVTVDQRALPRELRELRITTVDDLIDAITSLAIRGAPAIGVSGAFGVVIAVRAHTRDGVVDVERVRAEAQRIADARPTAVNLAWGVRRALSRLAEGAQAVLDEALEMLAEDGRVNQAAATHAADLVLRLSPNRPLRILTHCNTGRLATTSVGTALGALRVLHERGALAEVIVDETRPLLQGARLTAWELAEAGIPHRLTIDSAAAWAIATEGIDAVIVGADRITADGAVANKIGTYMLALAARHHGIPFIVVAPESTRDIATASGRDIVVEQRAAAEVTGFGGVPTAPEGTRTFNPAFDVTPPELVTAVVTEYGVLEHPGEVRTAADAQTQKVYRQAPAGTNGAGGHSGSTLTGTTPRPATEPTEERSDHPPATETTEGGLPKRIPSEASLESRAETAEPPAAGPQASPGEAATDEYLAALTRSVTELTRATPAEPGAGREIAALARGLYASGWMPGTAGNISVRQGVSAVITASGLSKGELTDTDTVTVRVADSEPALPSRRRPSAETTIHTAVYRATPAAAVVHVHPPHATALSVGAAAGSVRFSGYELIKGLGGTSPHTIDIPVFPNHAEVPRIGRDIERYLLDHSDAPPVLFIAGHGITAWGASLAQARDRAECLEALCELASLTGHREIPVGDNGSEEDPT
ncbi:Methylthioribose-1-phosphate isomerase [Nocardia otitidiscaviarum]|uniref:Methylthioribose-1-phosphate isomerase n=1 Tax=Nocardia otitidiscaviarum TaxID=1823 RepID=A0A379JJ48_9NOCA|nr:bifunctional S-methyl-5-thioribose-1-phosphate isomerase/methylthioribulose 1-phosphate dehydratase [Nocardia otitidiscaviarum]SUD48602.1 Methylthioribose-1-phosphate isomerase [Nocardia otitidiscaviarum]